MWRFYILPRSQEIVYFVPRINLRSKSVVLCEPSSMHYSNIRVHIPSDTFPRFSIRIADVLLPSMQHYQALCMNKRSK
jgi:hypothetical protein